MRILIVVVQRNAPARRIATRRLQPLRHADEYCWEDRPTAVHAAVVVGTVQRPELALSLRVMKPMNWTPV